MRRITSTLVAFALTLAAASCGGGLGGGYGSPPTAPPPGGPPSTSNMINIGDDHFTAAATTIPKGTTVTWTWTTGTTHNVTFGDGSGSGDKSGGTFTRTFNTAGTFNYVCTIHQTLGMTGTITVQ